MASGPQKPDHGGNFYMAPRRVQDSVAWRCLSLRARVVLQVLQARHDGFNNGRIGISVHEIGTALGDQNHGANSKAVAELIEKGFVECTADANRHQSKVRTYRLTFIPTGEGKRVQPATHEYRDWRPQAGTRKKFGGARTATQNPLSVVVTATDVKSSVVVSATPTTGMCGLEAPSCGAVTARYIGNQSEGVPGQLKSDVEISLKPAAADLRTDVTNLREWARAACGAGGQRAMVAASGVPAATLSRFLAGKGLPDRHRTNLQNACGRTLPYSAWLASHEQSDLRHAC